MSIQPIETRYAGHKFRSRLEARWAVFFDALGVEWQYEPQGYVVGVFDESRAYLPDFYLPGLDLWAEVKGDPSGVDWALWGCSVDNWSDSRLPDSRHAYSGEQGNGSALVILGNIPPETKGMVETAKGPDLGYCAWRHPVLINRKGVCIGEMMFEPEYLRDLWYVDDELGCFDATWGGLKGEPHWRHEPDHNGRPFHNMRMNRRVHRAYRAARQARFEHGETPA